MMIQLVGLIKINKMLKYFKLNKIKIKYLRISSKINNNQSKPNLKIFNLTYHKYKKVLNKLIR